MNSTNQIQTAKNNETTEKHANINDITSPAKELEVEQDDLEEEDDDDDDEDDDEDEEEDGDEDDDDDEEVQFDISLILDFIGNLSSFKNHPCPPGSSSCDEENSSEETDDTRMEQQAPTVPSQSTTSKCKRCGGDHSLEDQQSQTSSDKQSNSSAVPGSTINSNTLTYQQKRQRSIAKRLQLRRKKKN